jgi:DNA repair exonuclease SbcCD ATPase subunit
MDEQTSSLLIQYFNHSIEANKEIVKQLGSFNENMQQISRKLEAVGENIDDIYSLKNEIQEILKGYQEILRSLSNEEKALICKAIVESKNELKDEIIVSKEDTSMKIGKSKNELKDEIIVSKKDISVKIGELPEGKTISSKIDGVINKIADFKLSLITVVTLTVAVVTSLITIIIKIIEIKYK